MGLTQSSNIINNEPLSPFESKARIHAHVAFFAFVVGLPLGMIAARYLRTVYKGWLLPHMIINGLFVGPLVFAAFGLGVQATNMGFQPHFIDPHQKVGLALFIMYIAQVLLGSFTHWIKIPSLQRLPGRRAPQNYLHVLLGVAIVVLASWQTHYGLWTEWAFVTGNVHPTNKGCQRFWIAMMVVMWSIYAIGFSLLPRQVQHEADARKYQGTNAPGGTPEKSIPRSSSDVPLTA